MLAKFLCSARYQSEGNCRVQMSPGVVGNDDAGEDRESPSEVDHEEATAEALVLGQDHVGDDARTQK